MIVKKYKKYNMKHMKHLKTYNESIIDKMVPKSNDEIINGIKKLTPLKRYIKVKELNLPDDLLPTEDELGSYLKNISPLNRYDYVNIYNLPDDLLPTEDELKSDIDKIMGLPEHINLLLTYPKKPILRIRIKENADKFNLDYHIVDNKIIIRGDKYNIYFFICEYFIETMNSRNVLKKINRYKNSYIKTFNNR